MVSNAVGSNGDGAEDSGTPDGTQQVRNALERRWRDVDPNEIANAMLRPQLGAAGEWDPPEGVEPKRPLLYLSIGIPDGRALPREAMSQAMEKAFAHKNDAPFRYGYGDVKTREYLAENYSKHRGVKVSADWFQITKRIVTISGRSRSDNTRSDKSAGGQQLR